MRGICTFGAFILISLISCIEFLAEECSGDTEDLRHARMTQARLDADHTCQEDEDVAQAHCQLLRLRTELKDQELKEKRDMCKMEEERLNTTMRHLQDGETTTVSTLFMIQ